MSKWSKAYWADLAERVVSVFIYTLIPTIPTLQAADLSWSWAWATVGAPTVLALLTGIAANLKNPATGASVLPTPSPASGGEHLAE